MRSLDVDMGGVDISIDIDEVYALVLVYLINGTKIFREYWISRTIRWW